MSRGISRGKRAHLLALCGIIVALRKPRRAKFYEALRVIISGPAFGRELSRERDGHIARAEYRMRPRVISSPPLSLSDVGRTMTEGFERALPSPVFGAHDRLIDETDAGLRARMRAHAVPPDGEWILFRPGGPTAHEKMLAHVGEQISLAILGKG